MKKLLAILFICLLFAVACKKTTSPCSCADEAFKGIIPNDISLFKLCPQG